MHGPYWSVIQAAGSPESSCYAESLKMLCQSYWFPLYAYLCRCGYDGHEAEDYSQSFTFPAFASDVN